MIHLSGESKVDTIALSHVECRCPLIVVLIFNLPGEYDETITQDSMLDWVSPVDLHFESIGSAIVTWTSS